MARRQRITFLSQSSSKAVLGKRPLFSPACPAVNLKLFGTIPHQIAGKVGPVYVQLFKAHPLSAKVGTYGIGDTGLSNVGRRDAHGSYRPTVQVLEHVTLVAIETVSTAFAAVAHLGILHRHYPIARHPPA